MCKGTLCDFGPSYYTVCHPLQICWAYGGWGQERALWCPLDTVLSAFILIIILLKFYLYSSLVFSATWNHSALYLNFFFNNDLTITWLCYFSTAFLWFPYPFPALKITKSFSGLASHPHAHKYIHHCQHAVNCTSEEIIYAKFLGAHVYILLHLFHFGKESQLACVPENVSKKEHPLSLHAQGPCCNSCHLSLHAAVLEIKL